jgi:hypothetical protein
LGDGFSSSHRRNRLEEAALPAEIEPGLLEHKAYYYRGEQAGYWDEDDQIGFWRRSDGDSPPGLCEQSPLNFHLPAIRKYFLEQRGAYLKHYEEQKATYIRSREAEAYAKTKSSQNGSGLDDLTPEEKDNWDAEIYAGVLQEPYSKVWYEYHINQHIYFVEQSVADLDRGVKYGSKLGLTVLMIVSFSAELGRLIEQYYWKFLIEASAIRGEKTFKSAKAGGAALASVRKAEQARWQAAADLIWKKNPKLSKTAVGETLKKRLEIHLSAKHLARFLTRP